MGGEECGTVYWEGMRGDLEEKRPQHTLLRLCLSLQFKMCMCVCLCNFSAFLMTQR